MGFKDDYLKLKAEYKSDVEIAVIMKCSISHITKCKKIHDVPYIRKPRRNEQGLTEEELQKGEKNGLTRALMRQRIYARRWTNEKAILTPKMEKSDKRGRKFK